LRQALRDQEQELTGARARMRGADLLLAKAETGYADPKQKYDKLSKPARSARGRFLVEVRYSKPGDRPLIAVRPQGSETFRDLTRAELERELERLDGEHPGGLCIKVIFPENSGLSYNEAWKFTPELHSRFDYYYRDDAKANEPDDTP
jgi:hypothetical protein